MHMKQTLLAYVNAGFSAVPANVETKRPVGSWKQFQARRPTEAEIDLMLSDNPNANAIAIICGKVSGGLEVLDFDWNGRSVEEWGEFVQKNGGDYSDLLLEETQNHGYHIAYRIAGGNVTGNQKLAWKTFDERELEERDGVKLYHGKQVERAKNGGFGGCTIETRGEGGLIICAPSPNYKLLKGNWLNIPTISAEQAQILRQSALDLSDLVLNPPKIQRELKAIETNAGAFSSADYMREKGFPFDILERNGWSFVGNYQNDATLWRRPGKSRGVSGLLAHDGRFHCYTSSVYELSANQSYSPLQLLAALEYDGDETSASKAVFEQAKRNGDLPKVEQKRLSFVDSVATREEVEAAESFRFEFNQNEKAPQFPPKIIDYLNNDRSLFIRSFVNTCLLSSHIEQPEIYFGAAITALSYFINGRVRFGSVSPNIYTMIVSKSGSGKGAALTKLARCLEYEGLIGITKGFESTQVLADVFRQQARRLWLRDEAGTCFDDLKNSPMKRNVLSDLTELWSKNGVVLTSTSSRKNAELAKAQKGNADGINEDDEKQQLSQRFRALLSAFLALQPVVLTDLLADRRIKEQGILARFLMIPGRAKPKRSTYVQDSIEVTQQEKDFIDQWKHATHSNLTLKDNQFSNDFSDFEPQKYAVDDSGCLVIECTQHNRETIDKYCNQFFTTDNKYGDTIEEFTSRAPEYIQKFALLFAADKYGALNFTIDDDCFELAYSLWLYTVNTYCHLRDITEQNNELDRMSKPILKLWKHLEKKGCNAEVSFTNSEFTRLYRDKRTKDEVLEYFKEIGVVREKVDEVSIGNNAKRQTKILIIDVQKLKEEAKR